MNDPFVTFDTLSVGSEAEATPEAAAAPTGLPAILARLPRVEPRPRTINRFDDADGLAPPAYLSDTPGDPDGPTTGPATAAVTAPRLLGDPTATIRIDTVSFDEPDEPTEPKAPARPAAAPTPAQAAIAPPPMPESDTADDPWSAWLLNLESAIQPYSRWIALAAVIAALGLTVVLLRGGGVTIESLETAPQVSVDAADPVLAGEPTAEAEAPYWPEPTPVTPLDRPQAATSSPAPTQAVAAGPASLTRRRATLTGEVLPVETPRVDVADASAADPTYQKPR